MSRPARRLHWIAAALVLPALLLRALIPVGFMPMAGASGTLELGLCPATVDGVTFIAPGDPHAAHRDHGDSRSPPCPYALSAAAIATSIAIVHAPCTAADEKPVSSDSFSIFLPTIARAQLPRGPPAA